MNNFHNWTLLGWTEAYRLLRGYFYKADLSLNLISTFDFVNNEELLPESNIIIATTFKNYPNEVKQSLIDDFYKVLERKLSYLSNLNVIFISSVN